MSDSLHEQAFEVFVAACELKGDARQRFLDEACANDTALRGEVESLLAHDHEDDALSAAVAKGAQSVVDDGLAEQLPERIDRYRVLRIIGEGGMGTVYEAVQDGTERSVALKIVRGGAHGLLRRFSREIKLLGKLRHPGIAQIYDSGTATINGRPVPYFAMEFIRGQCLTDYATANRLDLAARLDLIARIADAVQFAHQYGVIHRDLKPGNILVEDQALTSSIDGSASATGVGIAMPKILDFGVARALDGDMQTLQTDVGQIIGTLAYMSPEQVSAKPDAIDTRSDVYAIGVIAYELLTGRRPMDVSGWPIHEAIRQIQEEAPQRPGEIDRTLRGDVETIILKAIEKEPQRRYQSAAELAADIRHFLADEPIIARQASSIYQLRKFARRNKPLVVAAFSIVAVLIGATIFSAYQAVKARQEAAKATEINRFLLEILTSSDPNKTKGEDVTVIALLEDATDELAKGHFGKQPEVLMELYGTVGKCFMTLGRYQQSEANCRMALDIAEKTFGTNAMALSPILDSLGAVLELQNKYEDAERYFRKACDIRAASGGDDSPMSTASPQGLPSVLFHTGRFTEAEKLYREALASSIRKFGERSEAAAQTLNGLGVTLEAMSRLDEAIATQRRAVGIYRSLFGEFSMSLADCLNDLANAQQAKQALAGAEESHREALKIRRKLLKPDHPDLATSLNNFALVLMLEGKLQEAETMNDEALRIRRKVLPAIHHSTAVTLNNRAEICLRLNRPDDALAALNEALAIAEKALPPGHMMPIVFRGNRGRCLCRLKRYNEAEREMLSAYNDLRKSAGPNHRRVETLAGYLVELYEAMGRPADAQTYRVPKAAPQTQPGA
jgi:serine/threonine protein kinase